MSNWLEMKPSSDNKLLHSFFIFLSFMITQVVITNGHVLKKLSENQFNSHRNFSIRSNSEFRVYHSCSLPQSFALTFDDGPTQLSKELDQHLAAHPEVKASYFINGNNFGCIYDYAELLITRFNQGHLIASHTWSHVHLNQGNYDQISRQIELLEQAMIKILGVKPLFFRPPYGEYNDIVLQVLRERGYKGLILWSSDSQDSAESPPSSNEIIQSFKSLPEKTISLNHEIQNFMVNEAVPGILQNLKSQYKLSTVGDCLQLGSDKNDWYEFIQKPSTRDHLWSCAGTPGEGKFD